MCVQARAGAVRRAEPGTRGSLLLEARPDGGGTRLEVWGPAATPPDEAEQALVATAAWAGLDDDMAGLDELWAVSPVLRRALRHGAEARLSRIPRLAEALGRAVLEQLVQSAEAFRSIAQVAVLAGARAGTEVWCWPTARQLGTVPASRLRPCGVSLRSARALHAGAVEDGRLEHARREAEATGEWTALDRRLRALPGVGAWTSAEIRLRLGDPDAVSVGDYHLPALVGTALHGPDGDGPHGRWTDAGMLELLAPFAGQRGRVIRLVEAAGRQGLVRQPTRRAPRAAYSAHRYY